MIVAYKWARTDLKEVFRKCKDCVDGHCKKTHTT